jgi:hypothetical protein
MFEFLIVLALIFAAYLMFFKDKSDAGQSSNEKEKDEAILNPPEDKTAPAEVSAVVKPRSPEKAKLVPAAKPKAKPKPKTNIRYAAKINAKTIKNSNMELPPKFFLLCNT